jgi:hypothetical protein
MEIHASSEADIQQLRLAVNIKEFITIEVHEERRKQR